MNRAELVAALGTRFDGRTSQNLMEVLVDELQLSIVDLRHVGWQSLNDHSLIELDTDEDYQPAGSIPVFVLGRTQVGVPSLNPLADED